MFKLGGYRLDPKSNKEYISFDKSKFTFKGASNDIDLRQYSSPRHDQIDTNTCVAQSAVKALEIKRIIKHGHDKHVDLSVLDLYYGARDLMYPKETHIDNGTYISFACDVLRRFGVARNVMHPFSKNNLFKTPPILTTREAALNKIHSHFKITSIGNNRIDDMILNLNAQNPIIFGTSVGNNWLFYNDTSSPIGITQKPEGRHAMTVVGFVNGLFIVENSWGTSWGHDGFAYVKPEVFTHVYTHDIWVIVTGSEAWFEKR